MKEKEFLPLVESRLKISQLNEMQRRMMATVPEKRDVILLSPTGSGKTLAFILPMLKMLNPPTGRVQAVVIAPSRELVLQIAGIMREIAAGYKVTALYGGHNVEDEVNTLSVTPDIVVSTPGRLLDHMRRRNIELLPTRILVLDEFDKSLELGFEKEMKHILERLKNVSRVILTSATDLQELPDYLPVRNPLRISYLDNNRELGSRIRVYRVETDSRDKLEGLDRLLRSLETEGRLGRAIVFVNHRESAERVADYLKSQGESVALYHGQLDQRDREKALARFNGGSARILVATDLAARGLDIEEVKSIIHYHQPFTPEAYTHRNGRTARQDATGEVYVLTGPEEDVKPFISFDAGYIPLPDGKKVESPVTTLYFSEGKKEKLSRGDIAGFLMKECGIPADEVGKIQVFDHYAFATVGKQYADTVAAKSQEEKIKGKKRRVTVAK